MSTANQSVQHGDRKAQMEPPIKKRRITDTIISLKDARVKLSTVERDFDTLEATHAQCPYWIQKNEHLVVMLEDHCESLESELGMG
ncbi:hypothetical protein N7478_000708 [Penicillium angulare]|uniref:uncharacterized protein n=1 Tax=Penicillium angulare TaxID=116970 RepID=UPI00254219EA|nr:uncharacterized protein N7478_000708 [Penicillium angulare]KAJ5291457.1 hypothetical protein N7478_000708 [Penicillium angulare]